MHAAPQKCHQNLTTIGLFIWPRAILTNQRIQTILLINHSMFILIWLTLIFFIVHIYSLLSTLLPSSIIIIISTVLYIRVFTISTPYPLTCAFRNATVSAALLVEYGVRASKHLHGWHFFFLQPPISELMHHEPSPERCCTPKGCHRDHAVLGQWVQFPVSTSCFLFLFPGPILWESGCPVVTPPCPAVRWPWRGPSICQKRVLPSFSPKFPMV